MGFLRKGFSRKKKHSMINSCTIDSHDFFNGSISEKRTEYRQNVGQHVGKQKCHNKLEIFLLKYARRKEKRAFRNVRQHEKLHFSEAQLKNMEHLEAC